MGPVFVSLEGDDKVAFFQLDPVTGELSDRRDIEVPGGPAPMTLSPGGRFLFVGLRTTPALAAFRVDAEKGDLSPLNRVPSPPDPCYLSMDKKGLFLLSAYYRAGRVAVHAINEDGTIHADPVEWRETDRMAHCIQTDPSNRFVFVPHTGPNRIMQFCFSEATGRLSPNSVSEAAPPPGVEPRHYCFHPNGTIVYFSNEEKASSVSIYRFDPARGTLHFLETTTTLPAGYSGDNTCAQIRIVPNGRFLFVSNRGHDSIATFSVDPDTGALEPTGHAPTEPIPRAFNIDPSGRFLYAAGLYSGRLSAYNIDQSTGKLEQAGIYHVGEKPMWIEIPQRNAIHRQRTQDRG